MLGRFDDRRLAQPILRGLLDPAPVARVRFGLLAGDRSGPQDPGADLELARLLAAPAPRAMGNAASLVAAVDPRGKLPSPGCARPQQLMDDLQLQMSRNRTIRGQKRQEALRAKKESKRLGETFRQAPDEDTKTRLFVQQNQLDNRAIELEHELRRLGVRHKAMTKELKQLNDRFLEMKCGRS